jgi:hypothetical protein
MMKNTGKITRVRLQVDNDSGLVILGLVSSEPDYKLSLALNKKFGISLRNADPVIPENDDGTHTPFSRFTFHEDFSDRTFNLVSNRSGSQFLVKKLKNVDYLFAIHDPENDPSTKILTSGLKSTPGVTAVFTVKPDTLKDKNLDLVMH